MMTMMMVLLWPLETTIEYSSICFRVDKCAFCRIIIIWHFANLEFWIHRYFDGIGANFHFTDVNPLAVNIESIYIRAIHRNAYSIGRYGITVIAWALFKFHSVNFNFNFNRNIQKRIRKQTNKDVVTLITEIGASIARLDVRHALVVFQAKWGFVTFSNAMSRAIVNIECCKYFHAVIMPADKRRWWYKCQNKKSLRIKTVICDGWLV